MRSYSHSTAQQLHSMCQPFRGTVPSRPSISGLHRSNTPSIIYASHSSSKAWAVGAPQIKQQQGHESLPTSILVACLACPLLHRPQQCAHPGAGAPPAPLLAEACRLQRYKQHSAVKYHYCCSQLVLLISTRSGSSDAMQPRTLCLLARQTLAVFNADTAAAV